MGLRHIKGLLGRIWWDVYRRIIENMYIHIYMILECGSDLWLLEGSYWYNN
jgi:hypothetical protein